MANGKIIIDVELNDDGVLKGLKNIEGMGGGSAGKKDGGLIGGMFGGMKNIIGAGLALKGVQAAWNGLKNGVSGGISRYDTMQRFPRMMQQIGFTSGEADLAIQSLSDGIQGLPTALDSVTGTAQQIALMTGDLTGAVDTTIALNNAFLASGSSSADASRGMVQFQQMLARGEPDLQSWRTLMETMPVALSMVSEELGYSGDNLYGLYDAMQAGEITFQDFTDALIDLNEQQGGLAEMALQNSVGIATSWQNIKTAVGRGWADLIDATDRGLESIGAGTIAEQMNKIKGVVDTGFGAVTGTVSGFFGIMSQFQAAMGDGFSNMSDGISLGVRGATQSIKMTTEEITALATNWNSMTLEEKQAQVQMMGKEDVGELLQLLGVDFESLPSEYHKDAYANAYGYDALEELLFLTGEWHDLTLEEKRAVLEAQIENEQIEEVIEQRDLWNDEEFIRQLAEINMNDNGALEQVVELINEWGVLEGLPPIDLKVDIRQIHPAIQAIADLIKAGQAVASDFFRPMTEGFQEIGRALGNFRSGFSEAVRHFNNGDWERSWSRLKNSTIQVFDEVGNAVSDMWTGMQESFKDIEWRELGTNILSGIQDGIRTARGLVTTIGQTIKGFIFNSLGAQSWGEVGETVISGIITGIESAVSLVMVVGGAIKSMIFTALDAENWGDVAVSILSGIATSIETVGSLVLGAGQAIKEWVFDETGAQSWGEVAQVVLERIGNQWNNFTHSLGEVGATISGWVFEKTGAESWEEVARMTFSRIGEAWGPFRSSLGEVGSTIKNWVFERTGAESWGEVAESVFGGIGQAWSGATDKLGDILTPVKNWIFEKFEAESWSEVGASVLTGIKETLEGLEWGNIGETVGTALGNALLGMGAFVATVIEGIQWGEFIEGLETGIASAMSKINVDQLVKDFLKSFVDSFTLWAPFEWGPLGQKIVDSLKETAESASPAMPELGVDPHIKEVNIINPEAVDEEVRRMTEGQPVTTQKLVEMLLDYIIDDNGKLHPEITAWLSAKGIIDGGDITVETLLMYLLNDDGSLLDEILNWINKQEPFKESVDVEVETNPEVMESHTLEPELQGVIKGQVIEPIEKDVVVNPNIVVGHSAGGGGLAEEGAQPGSLAGGGMFARLIEQVNQGMVQVQEAVTQGMTQVNESISLSVQTWGETLTLGFSTLTLGVTAGMLSMTMAVALGFTGMTLAVTTGMIAMSLAVTTGMVAITLAISVAMTAVDLSVSTNMTNMTTNTDTAMTEMSSATDTAMTEMSSVTETTMTEMSTAVDTAMTEASTATDTAMTEMQSATESAMDAMVGAVEGGMDSAVGAVESGVDSIIASLQSVETPAFNAGLNIGYGLARGINASAPVAIAAAQYLADSVNNILNSVFRFGSPSKVTTQYGEWIGEGLGNGIRNSLKYVNRSSDLLGQYAIPSINTNQAIGLGGYGSAGAMSYQSEVNLHIGTFVNNREEDLPQLMEEIRYYENVRLQGGM